MDEDQDISMEDQDISMECKKRNQKLIFLVISIELQI